MAGSSHFTVMTNYLENSMKVFRKNSNKMIVKPNNCFALLIGNIMILRAIFCHKELQTPTNLFLTSLAVADLLTTLYSPIGAASIGFGHSHVHFVNTCIRSQIVHVKLFSWADEMKLR